MKRTALFLSAWVLPLALSACGQNVGWVIKPVPLDERLRETVVASDSGLFVRDKVVIVDLDGIILNNRHRGLLDWEENPVSLFIEKIDKAEADDSVKALVVRINSPGGSVTASDILYHRLVRFRQARKVPVIAMIEDLGASGGYYLACGADSILAHPTSVTGSIGVIVQAFSLQGTMKLIGVEAKAVTSGQHKDMLSPFKPLDPKDMAIVQAMVDDFYGRFVKVVVANRCSDQAGKKLTQDQVKKLCDGRVYTGQQALDAGLIDALGYMNDAILLAKKRSGASRVKVVLYDRPMGYNANFYSQAPVPAAQFNLFNLNVPDLLAAGQPQFLYLWTGQ